MSSLAEMSIGDRATVQTIDGTDEICMRLMEMGITPGTEISLIGSALLGDPLELEVLGYRLSLRKSEAARISVSIL